MTEEAKRCVNALRNNIRNGFYWIGNAEFSMPCKGLIHLIESLSEQLDQVTRERDAAINALCKVNDVLSKNGWTGTTLCMCEVKDAIDDGLFDILCAGHEDVEVV